jgi:glutathione synthase/RimK-type ligase-like ATP-grasp enzyme
MIEAARKRGYEAMRIARGREATPGGLGFLRPHAVPSILEQNHADYLQMAEKMVMVQDFAQVEVYEDKSAQFWRWGHFMPATWRFESKNEATDFVSRYGKPLVSKADVGASSYNVRILHTQADQLTHVQQAFGRGIPVNHCAGGPGGRNVTSMQRGYVLLQEYIQNEVTWRINVVGRCYAIFKRFNAPGTFTAQTGNVEGLVELDEDATTALETTKKIVESLQTKWCAFDLLRTPSGAFKLIETSLAWPWPSPGNCMQARFFGPTQHVWAGMWDLMLDEYEAGIWS